MAAFRGRQGGLGLLFSYLALMTISEHSSLVKAPLSASPRITQWQKRIIMDGAYPELLATHREKNVLIIIPS
jgi:hypothetical protein